MRLELPLGQCKNGLSGMIIGCGGDLVFTEQGPGRGGVPAEQLAASGCEVAAQQSCTVADEQVTDTSGASAFAKQMETSFCKVPAELSSAPGGPIASSGRWKAQHAP